MSLQTVLADLKGRVGKEAKVGEWLVVDQKRINLFADATGDHQWIHVDPERAKKESPFKDAIAHGFLTLSLLPSLTREVQSGGVAFPGVKLGVNYGLNKVRFPSPVKVNSRIRTKSVLKEVTEVEGGLQMVREVTVEIEGQPKPACVAETVSRLYF
jgi:acyl dehydratase